MRVNPIQNVSTGQIHSNPDTEKTLRIGMYLLKREIRFPDLAI